MSDVTMELAKEAIDKAMEIARLNAENAKLREQVERLRTQLTDMTESVGRVEERCAKTFEVGKRWMAKAARFEAENAKLRELVRGLHMAYVGALNECEGMDAGLIWDHCDMVDAELAKSHARFEVDRQRFDVAMRELRIGVDE